MSTIEEAVIARIKSLNTGAGARVFSEAIEQSVQLPAISVSRTNGAPLVRTHDAVYDGPMRSTFRIEVLNKTLGPARAVGTELRTGLHAWRGTSLGVEIMSCLLLSHAEASLVDGDDITRLVQQEYELIHR